jgi:hypothetical protein
LQARLQPGQTQQADGENDDGDQHLEHRGAVPRCARRGGIGRAIISIFGGGFDAFAVEGQVAIG